MNNNPCPICNKKKLPSGLPLKEWMKLSEEYKERHYCFTDHFEYKVVGMPQKKIEKIKQIKEAIAKMPRTKKPKPERLIGLKSQRLRDGHCEVCEMKLDSDYHKRNPCKTI